jgi:hypothetical protein
MLVEICGHGYASRWPWRDSHDTKMEAPGRVPDHSLPLLPLSNFDILLSQSPGTHADILQLLKTTRNLGLSVLSNDATAKKALLGIEESHLYVISEKLKRHAKSYKDQSESGTGPVTEPNSSPVRRNRRLPNKKGANSETEAVHAECREYFAPSLPFLLVEFEG